MVPMTRKTQRKMLLASVPNLSMIFPWAMVKMIPNTCAARRETQVQEKKRFTENRRISAAPPGP